MPNYITHGLVHKKGLGKQRVGKQTGGQSIKGENRFENGAHWRLSLVGCVKAMWRNYTPRFKTKASSAPVPGLLTVQ